MPINTPTWLQSIHHDGSPNYVSRLYPRLGKTVQIRIRTAQDAPVRRIFLRFFPDGEQSFLPLEKEQLFASVQWWHCQLPVKEPVVTYRFLIETEDGIWHLTAAGPVAHEPRDDTDFRILTNYQAPAWVHSTVFYQIFPDRFANGDPSTDPRPEEYEYRGQRPLTFPWNQPPANDTYFPLVFYGGDIPGISQHLDHLERLGVNALYLNPIFTAPSNHKYDVVDYEHVDPHFGGNDALIALRQALSERGIRYILDIVPNHCGFWHPWFQKAQQDSQAPEADYFTFHNHPDGYEHWLSAWSLPKLNYRSQALRQIIYQKPDSVFRRWLQPPFAADGWRVDVANMLGKQGAIQLNAEIGQGIRQAVKETRPDAYLLAENFFDASPSLQGDQWDAVMNYMGFTIPLWHWLRGYYVGAHGLEGRIGSPVAYPTRAMIQTWQDRQAAAPWAITLQQYNQLDSHDVPRIRTIVNDNDNLLRLALIVQFTFPGVPSVYYGDEIGLVNDPHLAQRGCMNWDEGAWDHDLFAFYQRLIALRRESPVLQVGGFQVLLVEEDTFAFQREGVSGRFLTLAHRSETPRPASATPIAHSGLPDGTRLREYFTGQEILVTNGLLPLPELKQGATLWEEV